MYHFIDSLTFFMKLAIFHLSGSLLIILSLLTLIFLYLSDYLKKYFKLEEKYPKIAKFIELRRKFQSYYFKLNLLVIILSLLWMIFINFIILF